MKYKKFIILPVLAAIAMFLLFGRSKTYDNLDSLKQAQDQAGYVMLGRFGDNWPAKIVGVKTAVNGIGFTLKSGAKHEYFGYDGYELKVIRLLDKNKLENVVIFRSKEKK